MSTIRTAQLAEDDVNDLNYEVDLHELHAGRSSSPSDDEDDEGRPSKRQKLADDAQLEPAIDANELYASFKESVGARDAETAAGPSRRKVKIVRRFKFAGQEQEEEVEVWDDSKEALDYVAQASEPLPPSASPKPIEPNRADAPIDRSTAHLGQGYEHKQPEAPKAGPRKPKASLAAMKASLKPGKATKLSTLEKSKMDWNKYVSQNDIGDDLERGRKDGYTERQAFLERTQDRLESEFERQKSGSRSR